MTVKKITKIILVVVAVGLIAYDFIPFLNPERGDTISEVICYYGLRCISIPLIFGILMGHFFWPMKKDAKQYPKVLFGILAWMILMDVLIYKINWTWLYTYPIIWLGLGIPIGATFWQQNRE